MTKPVAKSLHTVTVLSQLARHIQADRTPTVAIHEAMLVLGLNDRPDPYGLRAKALALLERGT